MHNPTRPAKTAISVLALTSTLTLLVNTTGSAASSTAAAGSRADAQSSASGRNVETLILAFPFQGGHTKFIDRGKKGLSPGDLFLGTGLPILDNQTGRRIGTSDSVELIVSTRHDGTVTSQSTLRLPGGHIELEGVARHTDAPFRVTVTGGTGRYVGVGGQMTLVREDNQRKVSVMRLKLLR
jgi:hypothetical protein